MDNMLFFAKDKKGRDWYICKDCGNKEMSRFLVCPICHNEPNQDKEKREALNNLIINARGIKS